MDLGPGRAQIKLSETTESLAVSAQETFYSMNISWYPTGSGYFQVSIVIFKHGGDRTRRLNCGPLGADRMSGVMTSNTAPRVWHHFRTKKSSTESRL
jgi:hypothetical protein